MNSSLTLQDMLSSPEVLSECMIVKLQLYQLMEDHVIAIPLAAVSHVDKIKFDLRDDQRMEHAD